VSIKDREKFKEAIRTKLLLEVAGGAGTPGGARPTTAKETRVNCLIGRKDLAGQVGAVTFALCLPPSSSTRPIDPAE